MHLGNDIVDIVEEKELHNPRFPRRVLSDAEYMIYRASQDQKTFLWEAWSAKEAGYKLMKQLDSSCTFVPAEFIYDQKQKRVNYKDYSFPTMHEIKDDFIYCRTHHGEGKVIEIVREIEEALTTIGLNDYDDTLSDESNAARALLKLHLPKHIDCNPKDITVKKNGDDIPEVYINNKKFAGTISLSHHGRFVAVAIGI